MRLPVVTIFDLVMCAIMLSVLCKFTTGDVTLKVWLKKYDSYGLLINGEKCDFILKECDIYISACVKFPEDKNCTEMNSGVVSDDDDVAHFDKLTEQLKDSYKNPLEFTFQKYSDAQKLLFVLYSYDEDQSLHMHIPGELGEIDEFENRFLQVQLGKTYLAQFQGKRRIKPSLLTVRYKFSCAENFHGPACEVYCENELAYFCSDPLKKLERNHEYCIEYTDSFVPPKTCRLICRTECEKTTISTDSKISKREPTSLGATKPSFSDASTGFKPQNSELEKNNEETAFKTGFSSGSEEFTTEKLVFAKREDSEENRFTENNFETDEKDLSNSSRVKPERGKMATSGNNRRLDTGDRFEEGNYKKNVTLPALTVLENEENDIDNIEKMKNFLRNYWVLMIIVGIALLLLIIAAVAYCVYRRFCVFKGTYMVNQYKPMDYGSNHNLKESGF